MNVTLKPRKVACSRRQYNGKGYGSTFSHATTLGKGGVLFFPRLRLGFVWHSVGRRDIHPSRADCGLRFRCVRTALVRFGTILWMDGGQVDPQKLTPRLALRNREHLLWIHEGGLNTLGPHKITLPFLSTIWLLTGTPIKSSVSSA